MRSLVTTRPRGFGLVANLTVLLLILFTFVTIVNVGTGLRELSLLLRAWGGSPVSAAEVSGLVAAREALAQLQALTFLLCAPFVLIWVYQAASGARAIGAGKMAISPSAAVAAFFVPVTNLWLPYRALTETWRASHDPYGRRDRPTPLLLRAWWASWVACLLVGVVARLHIGGLEAIDDFVREIVLVQVSDVLAAVAGVLLMLVVSSLSDRQDAWHETRRAGVGPALVGVATLPAGTNAPLRPTRSHVRV